MILAWRLAPCAILFGKWIRSRMERLLEVGGANVSGRLLDPVLITQLPSKSYQWLLVLLGLTLILFLCALHWAGHAIWHYLDHWLDHYLGHYWGNASASWIIVTASSVLTLVAAYYLRQFERPELKAPRGETGKLDALIIFLSTPNPATPLPQSLPNESLEKAFPRLMQQLTLPLEKDGVKQHFAGHNWAMPILAISTAFAKGELKHVVVIGSADSLNPQNPEKLIDGSWRHAHFFCDTVSSRMSAHRPAFQVWPLPQPNRLPGVDFNSFPALETAVDDIYVFLKGKAAQRTAIDLTGGTKICTIVGLMHSLEPGRNAMYVTNNLKVEAYDFRYTAPDEGAVPSDGG